MQIRQYLVLRGLGEFDVKGGFGGWRWRVYLVGYEWFDKERKITVEGFFFLHVFSMVNRGRKAEE